MSNKNVSIEVRKSIVKGNVTDYALGVASNNDVGVEDLAVILKEISESLK